MVALKYAQIDIKVMQPGIRALYFQIPEGEMLIGDSGYKGEPSKISTFVDDHSDKVKEFFAQEKSRQETIGTRLKSFNILSGHFFHGLDYFCRFKQVTTPLLHCIARPRTHALAMRATMSTPITK